MYTLIQCLFKSMNEAYSFPNLAILPLIGDFMNLSDAMYFLIGSNAWKRNYHKNNHSPSLCEQSAHSNIY